MSMCFFFIFTHVAFLRNSYGNYNVNYFYCTVYLSSCLDFRYCPHSPKTVELLFYFFQDSMSLNFVYLLI